MSEVTRPRVGITGYGLAGRYFHAPLLKGAGFDVVGAVTSHPGRISHLKEDFPNAVAVKTVEELIALKIDLLVVATANIVHAKEAIAGLRAGVPVVVDKPMALNLEQTENIIRVAEETGVPVTTYFSRRWDSDALTVKRVIKEGLLGDIIRMDSRFERFRPEANPHSWRETTPEAEGGGLVLDLQPHLVSLALDWFGPAELKFSSVRAIRGGADDDSVLVLKHENGIDSYLSASAVQGSPGPRLRISGTKGSLVVFDLDPQEDLLRSGKYPKDGSWDVPTATPAFFFTGSEFTEIVGENGNYCEFYLAVKSALGGKSAWPVPVEDSLAVARILDEARRISIR
jgi:predicted dehydrogenase